VVVSHLLNNVINFPFYSTAGI